ncbi:MAG: right-handed parallel beta-helix repeat-containing protein [Deltaproteobacteria bacterium]|nr:right-handed parallel beta-helix repeat-containing protein [Deltaproteobacteria bacterium]
MVGGCREAGTVRRGRCTNVAAGAIGMMLALACPQSYRTEAEEADGSISHDADVPLDGESRDAAPIEDVPTGDDDSMPGDGSAVDGAAECPVWAVPDGSRSGDGTGSRDDPVNGVQRAFNGRGTCEHIILLRSADTPFSARLDLRFAAGGSLVIEGDPDDPFRAELDAASGKGLIVAGPPDAVAETVTLRHLAVRHGRGDSGGCLELLAAPSSPVELHLEDTEWTDCHASVDGGAVSVPAVAVTIEDSIFADDSAGNKGGAIDINGMDRYSADLVVERCWFQRDSARDGGAISTWIEGWVAGAIRIEDSRFADLSATDLAGALLLEAGADVEIRGSRFDRIDARDAILVGVVGQLVFEHNVVADCAPRSGWAMDCMRAQSATNNIFLRSSALDAKHASNNVLIATGGTGAILIGDELGRSVGNIIVDDWLAGTPGCDWVFHYLDHSNVWKSGVPVAADCLDRGNISVDPIFMNAAVEDFHLRPGSPCIDAGPPETEFNDPDGSRNDMGAFGGPGGTWTPLSATPP